VPETALARPAVKEEPALGPLCALQHLDVPGGVVEGDECRHHGCVVLAVEVGVHPRHPQPPALRVGVGVIDVAGERRADVGVLAFEEDALGTFEEAPHVSVHGAGGGRIGGRLE